MCNIESLDEENDVQETSITDIQMIVTNSLVMLPYDVKDIVVSFFFPIILLKSTLDEKPAVKTIVRYFEMRSEPFSVMLRMQKPVYKLNYTTDVIELLVMYLHSHKMKPTHLVEMPLRSKCMIDNTTCKFDAWFADYCDTKPNQLAYTTHLANFFAIRDLLHLLCAKMASKIKGVSLLGNDFVHAANALGKNVPPQMPNCLCGAH